MTNDSEMIERVAKAIYEEDDVWSLAWPWPNLHASQESPDAYRRVARAAVKAMGSGWQPIETAPKDGTWFIAVARGYVPAVVHWINDEQCFSEEECTPRFHEHDWPLTHWMPLPAPPEPTA